jgi:membrane protease YdiL (CAAX protease family)
MLSVSVFVGLLLMYVGLVAFAPDTRRLSRVNLVLRTVLLLLGVALNWQAFRGTPPFRPLLIPLALVCGQLLYVGAVFATGLSLKEAAHAAMPSPNIAVSFVRHPVLLLQYCFFATFEEFLWRATAQPFLTLLLSNTGIAVIMTALLFTILHTKMFTHDVEKIEFMLFSVILGLIYHLTGSLLFVVLVHLVRDLNIKFGAPLEKPEHLTTSPDFVATHRVERQPAAGDASRHRE